MDFSGLSRASLQQAMLNRLGQVADLTRLSKRARQDLYEHQKELKRIQRELEQIAYQLEHILAFPKTPDTAHDDTDDSKVIEIPKKKQA